MRIRTIITVGVAASIVSGAMALAEMAVSGKWTNEAIAQEGAAHTVFETILRRNLVLEDYLLHPGERSRIQWQQAGKTLARALEAPELADPRWATTVASLWQNFKKLEDLFPRLVEVVENESYEDFPDQIWTTTRRRLEVQLQTTIRENLSLASALERDVNAQTVRQLVHGRWLHIAAGGLVAVVLAGIWIILFREVFRPLRTLKRAIRNFGAGDRKARARLTADNEIGEAARAFDHTADALADASDALVARGQQLQAANKELEAFSYSVSHDLRGPLRSMDGFSQALLEDYGDKLDETGRDYLRRVRRGSKKMGRLIDDLLALSRVTRRDLKNERVDLSSVVRSVADELTQTAPERAIEIAIAPGVYANGDKDLIRIALQNLLGNAWKFTAKKPRARIEFDVAENNGTPTYFIRDDGAGFDMAYADKLFQPFTRLHGEKEFEGTGIGLATVQRIVHRHGGRIWAEGAVDKGATVYFTL